MGTVTKYDLVLLRCTEPAAEKVYEGLASGAETTTVDMICWSTPLVRSSSTVRTALCSPAEVGRAWTLTVTGLSSGSEISSSPSTRNVPPWLFSKSSSWRTARSGPDVRVIVTSYVRFWPAFRPPSRS